MDHSTDGQSLASQPCAGRQGRKALFEIVLTQDKNGHMGERMQEGAKYWSRLSTESVKILFE